jgi:hypothetical protein
MRINTNQKGTQLFLEVYASDCETKVETPISSMISCKVEQPIVKEFKDCVLGIGRYNGLTDTQICKQFVEDSLTEKEIRELIKSLEN